MSVFNHKEFDHHEQVCYFHDKASGLKAIIAIHNTNLGPALGGCRMWAYEDDDKALEDVLRLSRGMTYKAAITGVPLGGGKSVIIGDAKTAKTPALMRAMGRAVERMGGRYIIAEDVGTSVEDMVFVHENTSHVVGLPSDGADKGGGDPSPVTAMGVLTGLKAAVKYRLKKDNLAGVRVAVQGLGHVGASLCRLLKEEKAELVVTDMQRDRVEQMVRDYGAKATDLSAIYDAEVDVFAPCALGGIVNDDTIGRLKATVVAGAANNQLKEARHGDALKSRNILYAPDYVINAGGLLNVYYEFQARKAGKGYNRDEALSHVQKIRDTTEQIFKRADKEGVSTALAADREAESRFLKAGDCCGIKGAA